MKPLELQFINGEEELHLPKGIRWTEDSELEIDRVLENLRSRPAKIQNPSQAEIYKEKLAQVRELERAIRKEVNARSGTIADLLEMIRSVPKPTLEKLARESKDILNEITHWESLRRIGLSITRKKAEENIASEQQKLSTAKTTKEKAAVQNRIAQLKREGGLASDQPAKATSHGIALVKRWRGEVVNAVRFFKSRFGPDKFGFVTRIELDQHKINEHCKEIIRNGGTIDARTLPGIALTEETYGQFRG